MTDELRAVQAFRDSSWREPDSYDRFMLALGVSVGEQLARTSAPAILPTSAAPLTLADCRPISADPH